MSIAKNKKTKTSPDYGKILHDKVGEMSKRQRKGLFVFVALLSVILALLVTLFIWKVLPRITNRVTSTAEGAAINYITAVKDRDFDLLCKSVIPEISDSIKENAEQNGGGDTVFDTIYDAMENNAEKIDFGENISIEIDESSLKSEEQQFENGKYNGQDMTDMNVSAVTIVKGDVVTKGSLNESTQNITFVCVRIEKKWYILTMAQTADDTSWEQNTISK